MAEETKKGKNRKITCSLSGTSRTAVKYKYNQWKKVRVVAYFRLLIWWGAATMRQIRMQHFRSLPVVESVNQPVDMPVADWIIDHHQCFCLMGPHHQNDYRIVRFHPFSWQ